MSAQRLSPVNAQLAVLQPQWDERCGMQMASRVGADDDARLQAVALADLSFLPKIGLKGPAAARWLEARKRRPAQADPGKGHPVVRIGSTGGSRCGWPQRNRQTGRLAHGAAVAAARRATF